jgi:hypothetical protein
MAEANAPVAPRTNRPANSQGAQDTDALRADAATEQTDDDQGEPSVANPARGRAKRGEGTGPRRVQGPRPCYILLSDVLPDGVEVVAATRKAEEALQAIDSGKARAYLRLMVK